MQHDRAITQSFGPQAQAYLTSQVHATGRDLELLTEAIAETPAAKVLDLGCGAGHASFAAASVAGEVVSYDLTEAMLRVASRPQPIVVLPTSVPCAAALNAFLFPTPPLTGSSAVTVRITGATSMSR